MLLRKAGYFRTTLHVYINKEFQPQDGRRMH